MCQRYDITNIHSPIFSRTDSCGVKAKPSQPNYILSHRRGHSPVSLAARKVRLQFAALNCLPASKSKLKLIFKFVMPFTPPAKPPRCDPEALKIMPSRILCIYTECMMSTIYLWMYSYVCKYLNAVRQLRGQRRRALHAYILINEALESISGDRWSVRWWAKS